MYDMRNSSAFINRNFVYFKCFHQKDENFEKMPMYLWLFTKEDKKIPEDDIHKKIKALLNIPVGVPRAYGYAEKKEILYRTRPRNLRILASLIQNVILNLSCNVHASSYNLKLSERRHYESFIH